MIDLARTLHQRALKFVSGPIARGSITSVVIKLVGIGLAFVQSVIAARMLGVEGYGLVAVALAVVQIGATIAVFGLNTLSVREVARWLANGTTHMLAPFVHGAASAVVLISALIAAIIAASYTFAPDLLADYANVLLVSALIIPGWGLIQLFRGIAQGFGDVSGAQWPGEILRPAIVISLVLGSLVFLPNLTPTAFLLIYAAASCGGALVAAVIVRKHIATYPSKGDIASLRANWIAKAIPFFGLSVSAVLLGELATLMLAILATPEQAGLYQPIARVTPILALPATAAAMRYAPRVSELWYSNDIDRLANLTQTFSISTTAITTLATVFVAGAGHWLLLIFGTEFTQVAALLWIIGVAQIFDAACGPAGPILMMTGKSGLALRGYMCGAVVNVILGLALVPEHGATGAAIAVAGGVITTKLIMLRAVHQENGFNPSIYPSVARLVLRSTTDERSV